MLSIEIFFGVLEGKIGEHSGALGRLSGLEHFGHGGLAGWVEGVCEGFALGGSRNQD